MKVRIEIDTKTFVRFWLVVIGFAFAIFGMYLARTALIIVGASAFLALALNAPVNALAKRIPGKSRILATAVAFLAIVGFLGLFLFYVIPPITQQTLRFVEQAPNMVQNVSSQWAGIGDLVERYNVQPEVDAAAESIKDNASRWATDN